MITATHTYVTLDISEAAYYEIYDKLRQAGYDHCFHESDSGSKTPVIDMHGLALVKEEKCSDSN